MDTTEQVIAAAETEADKTSRILQEATVLFHTTRPGSLREHTLEALIRAMLANAQGREALFAAIGSEAGEPGSLSKANLAAIAEYLTEEEVAKINSLGLFLLKTKAFAFRDKMKGAQPDIGW